MGRAQQPAGRASRRPRARRAPPGASGGARCSRRPSGEGATGPGCGDVWCSPTVDEARRLVFVGTGNCVTSPKGYGRFAEAVVALDLDDGSVRWSYQPHQPNRDDLDFAGAPNLFEVDGRALVGLGNKDGTYYAVDRETGALVWTTHVVRPGPHASGQQLLDGRLHRPDRRRRRHRSSAAPRSAARRACTRSTPQPARSGGSNRSPRPPTARPRVGGGVVIIGGTDFTLPRARPHTGEVLWSDEVSGAVSGGPAIVGDDVFAVAGIREPGLAQALTHERRVPLLAAREARRRARRRDRGARSRPRPTSAAPAAHRRSASAHRATSPSTSSSRRRAHAADAARGARSIRGTSTSRPTGLGDPAAWLRPGSLAAATGRDAVRRVHLRERRQPTGRAALRARRRRERARHEDPAAGATYNRITVLAITDSNELPSPAEGVDRLVVTTSFDPPLAPVTRQREGEVDDQDRAPHGSCARGTHRWY